MTRTLQFTLRATAAEKRAVKRYARHHGKTVAELLRARVVDPALNYDPRQAVLPLGEKETPPRARTP